MIRPPSRSSLTGIDARAGLEPDLAELERRGEDERRTERRVAGERELGRRGEDPDPRVTALLRRQHEHGLGEVDLARERLEQLLGDLARVGEDGELVARERRVGEDVGDDVAKVGHGLSVAGTFLAPSV